MKKLPIASFSVLAGLAVLAFCPGMAQAQVTFTPLTTPASGTLGQTYQFEYTLTNTTTSPITFDGDIPQFTLAPSGANTEIAPAPGTQTDSTYLTLDDNPFFDTTSNPTNLNPLPGSATLPYHVFDLIVGSSATAGLYQGTFDITSGGNSVGSTPFSFTVGSASPVPEASSLLSLGVLLALGGGALAWRSRRRACA